MGSSAASDAESIALDRPYGFWNISRLDGAVDPARSPATRPPSIPAREDSV